MPAVERLKPNVVRLVELFENGRINQYVKDLRRRHPRQTGMPVENREDPEITLTYNGGGPGNVNSAVERGIVVGTENKGGLVFGIEDGCEGLVDGLRGVFLTDLNTVGVQNSGELIIGTSRTKLSARDRATLRDQALKYGLQIIGKGGDDTNTTVAELCEAGVSAVGVGKTVDDDLPGAVITFGHRTAIKALADLMVVYRRDAQANSRNLLAEIMGRKNGNLTLRVCAAAGATRSFIAEEYSQQGLSQLVTAIERNNDIARRVLADLAQITTIDGQRRSAEWIINNIADVDAEAVNLDLAAMVGLMHTIAGHRMPEFPYSTFAMAEGVAERIPATPTKFDEKTQMPIEWEMDILGAHKVLKADDHFTPEVGRVKIGREVAPQLERGEHGRRTFFERLTYEARCADGTAEDIAVAMRLGYHATMLLAEGRTSRMVVEGPGQIATSVAYSDLERHPVTGKIVPRSADLSSQEYLYIKACEYFLHQG